MLAKESILPGVSWAKCILLSFVMAVTVSVYGLLEPYTAPFWKASGLTTLQVNIISSCALLTGLGIQPLLGRLSDKLDARRPVMFICGIAAAAAMASFPYVTGPWKFFLLQAIVLNGYQYLNIVGGVIIGRLVGPDGSGDAYSQLRVYGSIGYVIVAQISGKLLPQSAHMSVADLRPVYIFGPMFFALVAVLAWFIPDPRRGHQPNSAFAGHDAAGKKKQSNHVPAPHLIPRYLLAFFFYQAALYGVTGNLSLYITERLHAKPSALASFFIAGVITEIIMMVVIGRISDRFGRRPALIVAFIALPFRLLGYIFAPTPTWAAVVQTMHGLNYGIIGTVGITLVNDCAEEHRRGTEQARLGVTASFATAVGQWICGFILQKSGFNEMFIAMTALSLIGVALMIFRVPETHPRFRKAGISAGL